MSSRRSAAVATSVVGHRGSRGSARGPARTRARLIAAAWLAGVTAIVAFALIGRSATTDLSGDNNTVSIRAGATMPAGRQAPSTGPWIMLAPALVPLTDDRLTMVRPEQRNLTVHTPMVEVAGTVAGGGRVVLTLESRGSHLLESRSLIVSAGGRYHASFALPNPRPGGRMWLRAVLMADNGLPIEAIRRPFISGPLVGPMGRGDGLLSRIGGR